MSANDSNQLRAGRFRLQAPLATGANRTGCGAKWARVPALISKGDIFQSLVLARASSNCIGRNRQRNRYPSIMANGGAR